MGVGWKIPCSTCCLGCLLFQLHLQFVFAFYIKNYLVVESVRFYASVYLTIKLKCCTFNLITWIFWVAMDSCHGWAQPTPTSQLPSGWEQDSMAFHHSVYSRIEKWPVPERCNSLPLFHPLWMLGDLVIFRKFYHQRMILVSNNWLVDT